ncbi:branched-chain amino acid ABC transporter permease [Amphritea balenae]|uniref:Branched-chain amino acid ABC transporter permease n=1 Tax=Amphritea balenae TaxID=452629 RepID=A0A3P1SLM6_9GAMM|nr:branched-chain amino acid ABC transporter permease [Amphritea balenae]RRC98038.1 branched-chain amino acid ABC transporter permease [Amphritea balenae]GGK67045.1 branched-chain amino acid ABC transporter permease [Amphritea balenae]
MFDQIIQFLATGLSIGSTYALVGLGFAIIYNASGVVNFAQGEFVMLGAMSVVGLLGAGVPYPLALLVAIAIVTLVGFSLNKFAIEPARGASVVATIIITIGASILLRGAALLIWGKDIFSMPAFTGDEPIQIGAATLVPQNLWIMGITVILVLGVRYFFDKTLIGKAILACSCNKTAAGLVGINVKLMLLTSYGLSAAIGAVAGLLIAPIAFTSFDAGTMLGLKGFAAAILGGMGSSMGAVAGGLVLGVLESLGAGLISSGYKDAIAFVIILAVLFFKPSGLFGFKSVDRV